MKNLVISILLMQIVTGLPFWQFRGSDRIWVGLSLVIVLWIALESMDELVLKIRRKAWLKKRRAEKFKLEVIDQTKKAI